MGAAPRPVDDRWLALLVEASADVVAVIDENGVLLYANPAAQALFGYDLDAWRGRSVLDLVHPDDLALALGSLESMLIRTDRPGDPIEVRVRTETGAWRQVELVATNRLQDERFGGLILAIRDITERRAAERGRASAERVLDHTFAHNPIGMTLCTLDGRFVKVNPAFCDLVGRSEAELLAETYQALTDPEELAAEQDAMVAVIQGERPSFTTDKRIVRKDGTVRMGELTVSMVEDPDGVRLVFGQLRDVTDQRELQRELEHRSLHDPLTGLANRALFHDRVTVAHHRHRRYGAGLSIAFVDLDDFKTVNDALGHAAGDELLRGVADRLTNRFRATDTVARVGGDEFAVLLDESGSADDAERLAAEIVALFDAPFTVGGRRLRVGASVGIAFADRGTRRRPRRGGAGCRRRPRHVRRQAGGQGPLAVVPALDALACGVLAGDPGAPRARLQHRRRRGPLPADGRDRDRPDLWHRGARPLAPSEARPAAAR